jgi:hypothetical protein
MPQDSFISSTINSRSRRSVSCASNLSCSSLISDDSKTSKVSSKLSQHDSHLKNDNQAIMYKSDFEGYRKNAKEEFGKNQRHLAEELQQEPDYPL